jgi:cytochrome P450
VLLPYGETLQRHRKVYHQVLRAEASASYQEIYSRQANELVINLLNTTAAADDDVQKQIAAFVLDSLALL